MGHVINKTSYKLDIDKKRVQAEWDNTAAREDWQEGCTGLPGNINWIDKTFNSYEEAEEYIDSIDRSYAQLAVKYKAVDYRVVQKELENSNKLKEALDKSKEAYNKYKDTNNEPHFKDVKSAYIGCRICGSKINKEKLFTTAIANNGNICPVCKEDWRPESKINKIKAYKEKWDKAKKDAEKINKEIEEKVRKKNGTEINWLVKTEYHV